MVYTQLESVRENETHTLFLGLWDTNGLPNPDQKTRPSDNQQKKKKKKKKKKEKKKERKENIRTCHLLDFAVSTDDRVKIKEYEKRDKYLDFDRELKKKQNNYGSWSNGDTNCNWCTWNGTQRLGKGAGRVGNRRISRDHHNSCIVQISQNTEKSSVKMFY